jgi:hypothetical protein
MNDETREIFRKARALLKGLRSNVPQFGQGVVEEPQIAQYEAAVAELRKLNPAVDQFAIRPEDCERESYDERKRWINSRNFGSKLDGLLNYLEEHDSSRGQTNPAASTAKLDSLDQRVSRLERRWRWTITVAIWLVAVTTAILLSIVSYKQNWPALARGGMWFTCFCFGGLGISVVSGWRKARVILEVISALGTVFTALCVFAA